MEQMNSIRHRLPTPGRGILSEIASAAAHIEKNQPTQPPALEDEEPLDTSTEPLLRDMPTD